MFTHYAQIENGQVVAYPVNPRVMDRSTGEYNVFQFWTGGELDGKTYVFCHNREPEYNPHTQNLVEGQPVFLEDENIWVRTHSIVEATDEEKAVRHQRQLDGSVNEIAMLLQTIEVLEPEIALLDDVSKARWEVYKQAVANMSNQPGFPFNMEVPEMNIDWPKRPDDDTQQVMKLTVERI